MFWPRRILISGRPKRLDPPCPIKSKSAPRAITAPPDLPRLAIQFLCSSIISEILTDYKIAFWDVMRAAWACDDAGDSAGAERCRDEALQIIDGLRRREQRLYSERGLQEQMLVDLYRRMGRFKVAQALGGKLLSSKSPPAADVVANLRFEMSLIEAADSGPHTFDEAASSAAGDKLFETDPAEQAIVEAVLAEVEKIWPGALKDASDEAMPACLYVVQTDNADWNRLLCLPPAGRVWLYDRQRQRVPLSHRAVPRGFYITGDDFIEGLMGHLGRSWMSTSSGPFHPFACFKFHIAPDQDRVLINYVLGPLWGSGWVGRVAPGDPVRLEKDESYGEWAD